jgi:putative addiction module component (TIGR02574 family)
MSPRLVTLGIDKLTVEERVQLITEIWESLPELPPPNLTAEQEAELDRRIRMMDADPTALHIWPEVEERLMRRLAR